MKSRQSRHVEAKDLIFRLCHILDGVDYGAYSGGRTQSYLDYVQGDYRDELTLVDPVFFPKFAEGVLGFKIGVSLIPKEKASASAERPDFLPADLKLHPFIFETKGTDSQDLTSHFP